MKYRIVQIKQTRNVSPIFKVVSFSETRLVIKSNFKSLKQAEAWNNKYGHSTYIIEIY